jgi:hypothetical protein
MSVSLAARRSRSQLCKWLYSQLITQLDGDHFSDFYRHGILFSGRKVPGQYCAQKMISKSQTTKY